MAIRVAVISEVRLVSERLVASLRRDRAFAPVVLNAADAVNPQRSAAIALVVLDADCADAIELCTAWTNAGSGVVVVNVPDDPGADVDALLAGARGIVYARETFEPVPRAAHLVAGGQAWGPRRVFVDAWKRLKQEADARQAGEAALASRLSAREREVLRFAAVGLANKEVAQRLAISEATVKVHLSHIFQKLGLRGRGELAAAFHGIIRP